DTETIQLQVLKLGLLKTDSKMREILSMLNEHNYAQAERLISRYIESSNDTIVQRTSQVENSVQEVSTPSPEEAMIERKEEVPKETTSKPLTLQDKIQQAKEKAIIDEFQLFIEDPDENTEEIQEEVSYDALLDIAPKPKQMSNENVNYDALLNVEADDVLVDNITLDISEQEEDTFFKETHTETVTVTNHDDFFDIPPLDEEQTEVSIPDEMIEEEHSMPNKSQEKHKIEVPIIKEEKPVLQTEETHNQAISYIDQKLKNMNNQYPPTQISHDTFPSVDAWLLKIANEGYSEAEVEAMIKKTEQLSQTNKSEAAQLLLVTAATQSKYAHFRLARALFKGEILQKNPAEAFTIINRLAVNDDYPEAICDLAQFYEKGIGISKDKKKAEALYKEAMDLGIQRAMDHYERLRKENKGIFFAFRR
ncbi:MAG TPA: sel1 repeat family protein, partial [Epsilonproteobacteria bacterium]|nr:sel1 repeat family protein [Campylobacterota bacterium]